MHTTAGVATAEDGSPLLNGQDGGVRKLDQTDGKLTDVCSKGVAAAPVGSRGAGGAGETADLSSTPLGAAADEAKLSEDLVRIYKRLEEIDAFGGSGLECSVGQGLASSRSGFGVW